MFGWREATVFVIFMAGEGDEIFAIMTKTSHIFTLCSAVVVFHEENKVLLAMVFRCCAAAKVRYLNQGDNGLERMR